MITFKKIKYCYDIAFKKSRELSFYKTSRLKSKFIIFYDLLKWYIKYDEFDRNYFVRGSDVLGANVSEYSLKEVSFLRDEYNNVGKKDDYTILLSDKFIFWTLCNSWSIPTQDVLAYRINGKFKWESLPIDDADLFFKKNNGYGGSVEKICRYHKNRYFIDGEEYTIDSLLDSIDGDFIVQSRINQHEEINKLFPSTINTIRLITTNTENCVDVICAHIKIGTKQQKIDTWDSGSIIVKVNINEGKLEGNGYFKYVKYNDGVNGIVDKHPETNTLFNDYEIPNFNEIMELISYAHGKFNKIYSIGWDIVITDKGPIILEGNHNWGSSTVQLLQGSKIIDRIFQ